MNPTFDQFAAGFFSARATLSIQTSRRDGPYILIKLNHHDEKLLQTFKDTYGGSLSKTTYAPKKHFYTYRLSHSKAKALLTRLLPHLPPSDFLQYATLLTRTPPPTFEEYAALRQSLTNPAPKPASPPKTPAIVPITNINSPPTDYIPPPEDHIVDLKTLIQNHLKK